MDRFALLAATLVLGVAAFGPVRVLAAEKPPAAARVPEPKEVGGAKGWIGYAYAEKDGKVCYLVGHPNKIEPASTGKARIDAMVTERPHESQLDVVNFDAGVLFKSGSDATLDIDGKTFSLFTDKETAWARDSATDKAVTEALAKGRRATLKGTSAHGKMVTQTYSLDGFSDALAAIDKACNLRR